MGRAGCSSCSRLRPVAEKLHHGVGSPGHAGVELPLVAAPLPVVVEDAVGGVGPHREHPGEDGDGSGAGDVVVALAVGDVGGVLGAVDPAGEIGDGELGVVGEAGVGSAEGHPLRGARVHQAGAVADVGGRAVPKPEQAIEAILEAYDGGRRGDAVVIADVGGAAAPHGEHVGTEELARLGRMCCCAQHGVDQQEEARGNREQRPVEGVRFALAAWCGVVSPALESSKPRPREDSLGQRETRHLPRAPGAAAGGPAQQRREQHRSPHRRARSCRGHHGCREYGVQPRLHPPACRSRAPPGGQDPHLPAPPRRRRVRHLYRLRRRHRRAPPPWLAPWPTTASTARRRWSSSSGVAPTASSWCAGSPWSCSPAARRRGRTPPLPPPPPSWWCDPTPTSSLSPTAASSRWCPPDPQAKWLRRPWSPTVCPPGL